MGKMTIAEVQENLFKHEKNCEVKVLVEQLKTARDHLSTKLDDYLNVKVYDEKGTVTSTIPRSRLDAQLLEILKVNIANDEGNKIEMSRKQFDQEVWSKITLRKIKQKILAYGLLAAAITAIIGLYNYMKSKGWFF